MWIPLVTAGLRWEEAHRAMMTTSHVFSIKTAAKQQKTKTRKRRYKGEWQQLLQSYKHRPLSSSKRLPGPQSFQVMG